jgi:hypothetical protein
MITVTEKLLQLLVKLRDDLKLSDNDSYKYFESLVNTLSGDLTKPNPTPLLIQIKSGSKIVEYANFNTTQEKLWLAIWTETKQILESQSF